MVNPNVDKPEGDRAKAPRVTAVVGHFDHAVPAPIKVKAMARAVEPFLEDRRQLVRGRPELRKNAERLRPVIDAAPVAILDPGLGGNVHYPYLAGQ